MPVLITDLPLCLMLFRQHPAQKPEASPAITYHSHRILGQNSERSFTVREIYRYPDSSSKVAGESETQLCMTALVMVTLDLIALWASTLILPLYIAGGALQVHSQLFRLSPGFSLPLPAAELPARLFNGKGSHITSFQKEVIKRPVLRSSWILATAEQPWRFIG